MRQTVFIALFLLLPLAAPLVNQSRAQDFYGTGSSYTGQPAPMETLNAIGAEQRRQSAIESQLRSQQLQLTNDRRRAATSGANLGCWGKTAAISGCASKPMPSFDRRSNSLERLLQDLD